MARIARSECENRGRFGRWTESIRRGIDGDPGAGIWLRAALPAGAIGPRSILVAIQLGCAAHSCSLLAGSWITETKRCKSGVTIGQPVFGFAQGALLQEVAVVLGAEIVAERRRFPLRYPRNALAATPTPRMRTRTTKRSMPFVRWNIEFSFALDVRNSRQGHRRGRSEFTGSLRQAETESCSISNRLGILRGAKSRCALLSSPRSPDRANLFSVS